jgi:hypothetical protein
MAFAETVSTAIVTGAGLSSVDDPLCESFAIAPASENASPGVSEMVVSLLVGDVVDGADVPEEVEGAEFVVGVPGAVVVVGVPGVVVVGVPGAVVVVGVPGMVVVVGVPGVVVVVGVPGVVVVGVPGVVVVVGVPGMVVVVGGVVVVVDGTMSAATSTPSMCRKPLIPEPEPRNLTTVVDPMYPLMSNVAVDDFCGPARLIVVRVFHDDPPFPEICTVTLPGTCPCVCRRY